MKNIIIEVKDKNLFVDRFLKEYLSRGFGSLSKREIDILVIDLLNKHANLESIKNFELSLKLRLTESKIKNLKYEAHLKYGEDNDEFIKNSFLSLLKNARLKQDKTITVSIEDNFLRKAISAKVKSRGSFTDYSFNSEIVKIELEDFVYLLDVFYTDDEKSKIEKEINKLSKTNNIMEFKELFKNFIEEAVKSAGKEMGKQGVVLGIGYLSGGVVPLVSAIKNLFYKG